MYSVTLKLPLYEYRKRFSPYQSALGRRQRGGRARQPTFESLRDQSTTRTRQKLGFCSRIQLCRRSVFVCTFSVEKLSSFLRAFTVLVRRGQQITIDSITKYYFPRITTSLPCLANANANEVDVGDQETIGCLQLCCRPINNRKEIEAKRCSKRVKLIRPSNQRYKPGWARNVATK
jgi:hypothetical protein